MPNPLSRVKPRHALAVLSVLAFSSALAGCMSFGTPPASVMKLARMKPLEADPAAIRFALATPAFMRLRDGDITVTVKFDTGDPKTGFVEQYKPVIDSGQAETPGIDRAGLGDANVAVARFGEDDREGFRAMQARIKAFRAAGGKGRGSLAIGATGCRVAPVQAGPIRISAWLQARPDEDFFALMRDFDLRARLKAAGADPGAIPLCADASVSG